VAVVHREGVDVVVAVAKLPEGDKGHNNDENESEHFLPLAPLRYPSPEKPRIARWSLGFGVAEREKILA